jgi:predicted TIM-barrel fold metal-dependent hydrolase
MEILDAHIHLFDTARAQGVPWPGNRALPSSSGRLREVSASSGVSSAIHVEASDWEHDNDWVLGVTAQDPFIAAIVGNLDPAGPDFAHKLDRYQRFPKFRGIRYGNLWGRDLGQALNQSSFVEGLRELARRQLSLDSADPTVELLEQLLRLTDLVPGLHLILDHLPRMASPRESVLRQLAQRNVFLKISYIPKNEETEARDRIAVIRDIFPENVLMYASDWPNSAGHWRTYAENFALLSPPANPAQFYSLTARRAYRLS